MSKIDENIDPFEGKTAEEIAEYFTEKGALVDESFDKLPFVDWNNIRWIKGLVGAPKVIKSKFENVETGEFKATVCPVGDYMVNCTGMLKDLPKKSGSIVVIVRSDEKTKGAIKDYWTFIVLDVAKKDDMEHKE